MTTLWADKARPIQALITDGNANKTWAFTGSSAEKPGVYFEIKDGINPLPYKLEKAKGKDLPETYKTVLEYARFLDKNGKIQKAEK